MLIRVVLASLRALSFPPWVRPTRQFDWQKLQWLPYLARSTVCPTVHDRTRIRRERLGAMTAAISPERLRAHVVRLADEIGERNVFRPAALDAAVDYVVGQWESFG